MYYAISIWVCASGRAWESFCPPPLVKVGDMWPDRWLDLLALTLMFLFHDIVVCWIHLETFWEGDLPIRIKLSVEIKIVMLSKIVLCSFLGLGSLNTQVKAAHHLSRILTYRQEQYQIKTMSLAVCTKNRHFNPVFIFILASIFPLFKAKNETINGDIST